MNNTVIYSTISFLVGVAASALVTYKVTEKVVEKKYNKIAQDEINSVKEKFTVPKVKVEKKEEIKSDKEASMANTVNKPSLSDYAKKIKEYVNYSTSEDKPAKKKEVKPFVISPDEYGEDEEYDQQELTYYADGILADEDDTILDADEVIGSESLNHIGDYEDDAVHVKNETRKIYYEVLVDERSYERATGKKPHLDTDEED